MTRHAWLAAALPLLLTGGGGIWWWAERPAAAIVWQGHAEADFVKIGLTHQELLTSVFVARSEEVVIGEPLFNVGRLRVQTLRNVYRVQPRASVANCTILRKETGARPDSSRLVEIRRNLNTTVARIDGVNECAADRPAYNCIVWLQRQLIIDARSDETEASRSADEDASRDGQQNFRVALRLELLQRPSGSGYQLTFCLVTTPKARIRQRATRARTTMAICPTRGVHQEMPPAIFC